MTYPYARGAAIPMPWNDPPSMEAAGRATDVEEDESDAMERHGRDDGAGDASARHGAPFGDDAERLYRGARDARFLDQLRDACARSAPTPRYDSAPPMSSTPPPAPMGGFARQPAWQPQQPTQWSQWSQPTPTWSQALPHSFPHSFPAFGASPFPAFNPYSSPLSFPAMSNPSFSPLGGAGSHLLSGGVGMALGLGLGGLAAGVGTFLGNALGGFGSFGGLSGFGGFGGFGGGLGHGFGHCWREFSPSYCGWW